MNLQPIDIAFILAIGFLLLIMVSAILWVFEHQCPENKTGIYIGEDWYCINSKFINRGGIEYLNSSPLI